MEHSPQHVASSAQILAPASGTADLAVAWLAPRADSSYPEHDIRTIVAMYRDLGDAVGVDWFLALAQLAHETGSLTSWWSLRPRRNPAGIGVTGRTAPLGRSGAWAWNERTNRWHEGVSFATWGHAAPAHLGRLLAYALRDEAASAAQQALIARALDVRPLRASLRGVAPRWVDLNGRWAVPGATYGQAIVALAARMRGAP